MKVFTLYKDAFNYAVEMSSQTNIDCGISKTKEFGRNVFSVSILPKRENRRGKELMCEVVEPNTPQII